MSVDLLQQLVKLMATNDLNTVDLRDGDKRVILKRGVPIVASPPPVYAPAPPTSGVATSVATSSPSTSNAPATPADEAGTIPIKSPMVGTFYAKPSPEAKAFVKVGSVINEESDVCVIEAMKVFNNIKAELKGTITKIVAQDGKPVEFGQVLFLVKP